MARRKLWQADEVRRALVLYLSTPFGRIHNRNPQIIQLAGLIGRTASSVALKMSNLAALDASLARKGMANASKLDHQIWQEYLNDPSVISEIASMPDDLQYTQIQSAPEHGFGEGIDISAHTTQRKGQNLFRKSVLVSYQHRCALTKVNDPKLLVASHIIGWAENTKTRMDPSNGICLNALHDKAFDRHLISFDEEYRMLVSEKTPKDTRDALNMTAVERLRLPDRFLPSQTYLAAHRDRFFELQG